MIAIKSESSTAIQNSFEVLGRAAALGLMNDPTVAREMGALGEGIDKSAFEALEREAGIPTPPAASKR